VIPQAVACGEVVGQFTNAPLFEHEYHSVLPLLPLRPSLIVEPANGDVARVIATESMFWGLVESRL
jgi:hypothetical protein